MKKWWAFGFFLIAQNALSMHSGVNTLESKPMLIGQESRRTGSDGEPRVCNPDQSSDSARSLPPVPDTRDRYRQSASAAGVAVDSDPEVPAAVPVPAAGGDLLLQTFSTIPIVPGSISLPRQPCATPEVGVVEDAATQIALRAALFAATGKEPGTALPKVVKISQRIPLRAVVLAGSASADAIDAVGKNISPQKKIRGGVFGVGQGRGPGGAAAQGYPQELFAVSEGATVVPVADRETSSSDESEATVVCVHAVEPVSTTAYSPVESQNRQDQQAQPPAESQSKSRSRTGSVGGKKPVPPTILASLFTNKNALYFCGAVALAGLIVWLHNLQEEEVDPFDEPWEQEEAAKKKKNIKRLALAALSAGSFGVLLNLWLANRS